MLDFFVLFLYSTASSAYFCFGQSRIKELFPLPTDVYINNNVTKGIRLYHMSVKVPYYRQRWEKETKLDAISKHNNNNKWKKRRNKKSSAISTLKRCRFVVLFFLV